MAERIGSERVQREEGWLYYINKDGYVYRKKQGGFFSKNEKIGTERITRDINYLYFVDRDGYVARVPIKKNTKTTSAKKEAGWVDIRTHPLEKQAIEAVVGEQNKNFMKPSARLTVDENGKADVWVGEKKWVAYNHQGIELKNSGRFAEAIEKFNQAIKEEPKAGIPHHGKADALLKLGNYEDALKEADLAISLDKKIPEVLPTKKPAILEFYFRKIQILLRLGMYEGILEPEMVKYLMKNDPEGYEKGRDRAKEYQKILNKINTAPAINSKAKISEFNRQMEKAYNLMKSHNFSDALKEVEKALKLNPKDADAHLTKGLIIIALKNSGQLKDDSEGGREIIIAEALEPRNPNIVFVDGMVALAGGIRDFANEKFVRVKFLDDEYITKGKMNSYKPFLVSMKK